MHVNLCEFIPFFGAHLYQLSYINPLIWVPPSFQNHTLSTLSFSIPFFHTLITFSPSSIPPFSSIIFFKTQKTTFNPQQQIKMSFQDIRNNGGIRPTSSQTPSQSIAAGIFQINTAVSAFRRLVDSIGTSKDTPNHRQKLHNTRQRILQLVKDTSAKLKARSDSDHSANVTQSKKIEDAKLARDFQATLQEFQKVQQLASERESSYMPSGAPTSSVTGSNGDEAKQDPESQPFLVEQKRQELVLLDNEIAFNEAVIEERDQGIKEIQGQIGQVNEIFKDLAVLVHEQGVVIDDIHSNVESSAAATAQARQQISKASKSERSGSTWCWLLLALFAMVIIIFVLVLIL